MPEQEGNLSSTAFPAKPSPDIEYTDYSFVMNIGINTYAKEAGEEIAKCVTALMNTSGGLVVLYCNRAESDKKRDQWLMNMKDHVTKKWIPNSTYRSLIRYRYLKIMGQLRIYLFVCKSSHIVTFKYNAHGRHATGIEPLTHIEDISQMMCAGKGTTLRECTSQMKGILKTRESFCQNKEIPPEYCESQNTEFKHYYYDDRETSELIFVASDLQSRLGRDKELLANVSAFANTDGGSLILGVKESGKYPIVRGFQTTGKQKEEEKALESYIEQSLHDCIWSGNSDNLPARGKDWEIFYYDVSQPNAQLDKVIEIRVPRHSSVMFLNPPVCFMVNNTGSLEECKDFRKWKEQICPSSLPTRRENKCNRLQAHIKSSRSPPKGPEDRRQHAKNRPPSKVHNDSLPNSKDHPTEDVQSEDVKLQKSFHGDDIEITVHDLNFLDCCTVKMAKYLDNHQGEKFWYPSLEASEMRNSDCIECGSLVKYTNMKAWHGIASIIHTERETVDPKTCLLCYVLIASAKAHPKLIYCLRVNSWDETMQPHHQPYQVNDYVRCALDHACKLKKRFLGLAVNKEHQSYPFHFGVEVLTVTATGTITQLWDSEGKNSEGENNQPVFYPYLEHRAEFAIACNGLAEELLKTRYTVKDRHGDVLIDHLTEEQARLLLNRKERVMVVTGRSGTGKTVIALHLVQDARARGYTQKEVLYICSSDGLKAFVSSEADCEVWVLKATNSLSKQQTHLLTETVKIIIVDDVHAISLSADWEENPNDLYRLLFTHSAQHEAEVAIFFDPDQDFQSCLPENFDNELRNLAEDIARSSHGRMLRQDIKLYTLNENIRNSRQINRFMQANQKQAKVEGSRVCLNEREGDGVIYDFIGNNLEENASYLNAKFRGLVQQFEERSIVVLCDDATQMTTLQTILRDKFEWNLQNSQTFPVKGIVMSMLEDFGGLEGNVVLFLLPPSFGAGNRGNWKYVNCISSRAQMKLECLLPWDPDEDPIRLQKTRVFLELFQTAVSCIVS